MAKSSLNEVFGIFNKLAPQHKLLIGIVSLVTVVLMIVVFGYLNQPEYTTLYSNMHAEDAAKVIEELNAQKVVFKLDNGGKTIKVPADNVHELRLNMAAKGIPSSGIVGYEIFDKSTLGMSEFMQRLNFKRALEGELARTITQQEGIEGARVHIVFPEKTIFKEEQKEPSASIVVKLRNAYSIDEESIRAILNLVASSVEGLKQTRVSLLDTQGRLLSNETDENDLSMATSKQYELKQNIENYLSRKAQRLLDNVVGFGNSMVQVDIDLDFDQVEKTMTSYDPDSQIAISEQTIKSENSGSNRVDSSAQLSENSIINYEISKTIQRVIQGAGTVKKLTVATVVNEVPKEVADGENTKIIYEPRSKDQLIKLEQIVKNSVGYDPSRNDNFSLVSIPFETNTPDVITEEELNEPQLFDLNQYEEIINLVIVIVGIIASLLFVRSLMSKLKKEKIIIGSVNPAQLAYGSAAGDSYSSEEFSAPEKAALQSAKKKKMLPVGDLEDEISDEAAKKKHQQERITNYVQKNPIDAAKLINYWLHEDELN